MSHQPRKHPRISLEQDFEGPTKAQDLAFAHLPPADEEGVKKDKEEEKEGEKANKVEETAPSTSAPLNVSPLSGTHPSSLSLSDSLAQDDAEELRESTGMPARSLGLYRSYTAMSWSRLHEESKGQKGRKYIGPSLIAIGSESLWKKYQSRTISKVVKAMVLKYRKKEPITQVEMLKVVTESWYKQFPLLLKKAAKCLQVLYGIDVKQSDQKRGSYVFVNSLNLTYDDTTTPDDNDDYRMPRNGFLILILGVILIDGNTSSEESIWKFLNDMGIYDGKEHLIYGEPRGFLTSELVQEKYLEYQQVPSSDPPCFQFLWGPRAHAETTKRKVLTHMASFTGKDPKYYSSFFAGTFQDDEERAWARAYLLSSVNAILTADCLLRASSMQKEELV